jgi:glycosyltransferase involved in cell wall biosynthesis
VQCRPSDVLVETGDAAVFAAWCDSLTSADAVVLDYEELVRDPEPVLWAFAKRFGLDTSLVSLAVEAVKPPESMGPLFTVVMTVYKRESLVPRALETVLWQTYKNWELRVFADGPHEVTRAMMRQMQTRAEFAGRLTYHESMPRPGAHGNALRRLGRDSAAGDYLCFLSHDCLLHPDYLMAHARGLRGGAGVSVVGQRFWSQSREQSVNEVQSNDDWLTCVGHFPTRPPEQAVHGDIDLTNMAFSTEAAKRCDIFSVGADTVYAADFLSFHRVRESYPLAYDSRELAVHF